ncbi:hypothetical protein [Paracoccus litorisediminis]|uniref:Uncharacterized protein n=1 Tax=Paracoccus litorisediminis TaxID=2006130 RepID=A0A844HS16_9RHOB|nr:hypothetical protein [Paracoccus litorisediminis]MTH61868.1 hypothetical protein [Paracoccus litorisediminis]
MSKDLCLPPIRADGLQLEEHRAFQERYWRVQRVAWLGYGTAMLLALLGLTGSGGAFHLQEIRMSGAVAQMPRVARWEEWDEIRVRFLEPRDTHDLTIGTGFFNLFEVGRIQPDPETSRLTTQAHEMRFSAAGPAPHEIRISTRPMHFGWARFDLGLDGESRSVNILVLP